MTFGARMRHRRHKLGLSQEKLADRCDLHWSYIGQIERGRRNIGLLNLIRVAEALEINPAELVDGLCSTP